MSLAANRAVSRELRHELRTPLNHILGYSGMLIDDCGPEADAAFLSALRKIHDTARNLIPAGDTGEGFLRETLPAGASLILGESENLLGRAEGQIAADIERIREAATRLLELSGTVHPDARPAAAPAGPATRHDPPAAIPQNRGELLVVDDNPDNREVLRRRLVRQGHSVSIAENGRQALEIARTKPLDLVLLDIMMPELDGFEVLKRMKADPALREIPVIMISALDEVRSVVRCIEMGAEDYLPKPFDPVLLRARIGATLEKKKLRNQLMVQEKLASLGSLTAGIAHEIRNPLNFITNFAELSADLVQELREALGPDTTAAAGDLLADLENNAAKIREHGKRADSIVQNMLMHSRGQSGERVAADVNALAAQNIDLAYHSMRAQNSSFNALIESDYDASAGAALLVPQDIGRVLLNLANNAFYAVHQRKLAAGAAFQPAVRVRTRDLGERVEIAIRDNGGGIPKDARDKLFTPFFTTKPAGVGTGLGLSMSYDIVVRGHQGEMTVESEEGSYAEFRVILPRGAAGR